MNSLYTRIDFRESHELLDLNAHSPDVLVLDSAPRSFISAQKLSPLRGLGPAVLLLDSPQVNNYLRNQSECKLSKEGVECKMCRLKELCQIAHKGETKGEQNTFGQISSLPQFTQLLQALIKHQKYHKRLYHSKGIISLLFTVSKRLVLNCPACSKSLTCLQQALTLSSSESLVCSNCSAEGKCQRTVESAPLYLILQTEKVKDVKITLAQTQYQLIGCSTAKGFLFMTTSRLWFNLATLAHVSPLSLINSKVSFLVYKKLKVLENPKPLTSVCQQPDSRILAYPNFMTLARPLSTKLSNRLRKYLGKHASCNLPVLFAVCPQQPQLLKGKREVHEVLSGKYRQVQRDSWDRQYDKGKVKKVRKRIQKSRRKIDFGRVALMNSHI